MTDERNNALDAIRTLLRYIGEDPDRPGLIDTPRRVIDAMTEMTDGHNVDIAAMLNVQFDVGTVTGPVTLADIPFTSLCEHHMLPFTGTAAITYTPTTRVVGLSKLARLVDAHANRLQVQERMTEGIIDDVWHHLQPSSAAVIVQAHHQCMSCRGVNKIRGTMTTTAHRGDIATDAHAQRAFQTLALD